MVCDLYEDRVYRLTVIYDIHFKVIPLIYVYQHFI